MIKQVNNYACTLKILKNKIKISAERSLFRWASMSKMITSIISLKLHQEGKLDIRSDIKEYFQNFHISLKQNL